MCHTVPIVKEPRTARAARAAGTWDRLRAAHLYRRAGFGGSPEELDLAVSLGREGAVSRLVDFERISSDGLEAYLSLFGFDPAGFSQVPFDRESELRRWWYLRMQYTPRPLEEKMTLFWHNHFATSVTKVGERRADVPAEPGLPDASAWAASPICCSRSRATRRCSSGWTTRRA